MLGDNVCDQYAALMPQYTFRGLMTMLSDACDHGVENVEDAPPELVAFIRAMETVPEWLDMSLVEEGARADRNIVLHASPWSMRGAFMGTFVNKYSIRPMAITGALSDQTARRRMIETSSYFLTTYLPGSLTRFGPGFKAAAMVRLMHSLVRFNMLRKPDLWDAKIYGIPIPQSDQMSPAIYYTYTLAQKVLASGRTSFNRSERARVELARYRGYLLGLPEDLAPFTPQGLIRAMTALYATLRRGYDEVSALQLTRSALAANLRPDDRLHNRIINNLERGFSKVFFLKNSVANDKKEAARRGVKVTPMDYVATMIVGLYLVTQISLYDLAERIPGIRKLAERRLVTKLAKLLNRYGHAEFATDADAYRPAVAKPTMSPIPQS
jgi:hypothetical protein